MSEFLTGIPWWIYCAYLSFGITVYGITMRFVEKDLHPSLFSSAFTCFSSIILFILFTIYFLDGGAIEFNLMAFSIAVFAGLSFVGIDLCLIKMYKCGAPVSIAIPSIRTGLSISSALIGVIVFRENLDLVKAVGIATGSAGIFLAMKRKKNT